MFRADLDRLFRPLFGVHRRRGVGLGLATVAALTEWRGGAVDVESEPGKGTALHIYMPSTRSAAVPADVFALTSRHEGSPNVVKEALACNLPVVAVNVGDVAERLRGVEGCAVAASDDPADLARALERVLASGARAAGRQAVAELDERLLTARVVEVYRQALASAPRAPRARRAVSTA